MLIGRPGTVAEVEELIVRVEACRDEAVRFHERALEVECEDSLAELHALRVALTDAVPKQRGPT